MTDLIGKKLKDFYVLRRLGRGAMAEVFLAQQLSLGRQVALKVLDSQLALDPNYVRRFHHEARAAAALVHGGIVQIYEVGQADGFHYIAQEYVAGRNLGELIRSRGSLPPAIAIDILRQVAAALSKAAAEGIVHRDIKPENIMLANSGEVKVADFGLARVQADHPAAGARGVHLTQVGVTMGTPLYMSPEQIEGREIDSRSDIYSLGITAYHMLAGEPPFTGDSPIAVAVQHLNETPPVLNRDRPGRADVPPRLSQVVERMMAKKPADRYHDPPALLVDLIALDAELSGGSGALSLSPIARSTGPAFPGPATLAEMLRASDERAQATNRLAELTSTMSALRPFRWPVRRIAAVVLACAALGAAVAAITRPVPLLAGADSGPPRSGDVWGQIYHAKMVDTEESWLAVGRYFPDASAYYHDLAEQGLAYFYLTRAQDYGKALRPLEKLAARSQLSLQAFGIAGLVVAYAQLGQDELAFDANQRLSTEMRTLLETDSPRMAALLNSALDSLANQSSENG